jgi:hypothetical protein
VDKIKLIQELTTSLRSLPDLQEYVVEGVHSLKEKRQDSFELFHPGGKWIAVLSILGAGYLMEVTGL